MFTDRLFAWRISSTRALVACPRAGRWHISNPMTERSTVATLAPTQCHPRSTRGILQADEFDPAWRVHDDTDALSASFLDTLPRRSGLLADDMKALRHGAPESMPPPSAEGYVAIEPGRVVVACPSCSGWHVATLDDVPMPGYRFSAMKAHGTPGCGTLVMRVTVQASSWNSSWGQRCGQGRQLSIIQTPAYVDHLTASGPTVHASV